MHPLKAQVVMMTMLFAVKLLIAGISRELQHRGSDLGAEIKGRQE